MTRRVLDGVRIGGKLMRRMTRSGPASLYEDDFFAWTQEQAAALRQTPQKALGGRVDLLRIAEEIEDLGRRDLREVSSFIGRLFEHLIKIGHCPNSRDQAHWRTEARLFRNSAADAFLPSMRRLIDLDVLWEKSLKRATAELGEVGLDTSKPGKCPLILDEILSEDFDVASAVSKLYTR